MPQAGRFNPVFVVNRLAIGPKSPHHVPALHLPDAVLQGACTFFSEDFPITVGQKMQRLGSESPGQPDSNIAIKPIAPDTGKHLAQLRLGNRQPVVNVC